MSNAASITSVTDPLATYKRIEARITKGDLEALLARWEFGRTLLAERDGKEKLPNGRLDALASALAISRSEIKNRMQFAEEYPSRARVRIAFTEHGSWFEICARGIGDRGETQLRLDLDPAVVLKPIGLLPSDLDGLSPTQAQVVVAEVDRAYKDCCGEAQLKPARRGEQGPEVLCSWKALRWLTGGVIRDLKAGKIGHQAVRGRIQLAELLRGWTVYDPPKPRRADARSNYRTLVELAGE